MTTETAQSILAATEHAEDCLLVSPSLCDADDQCTCDHQMRAMLAYGESRGREATERAIARVEAVPPRIDMPDHIIPAHDDYGEVQFRAPEWIERRFRHPKHSDFVAAIRASIPTGKG